MKYPETLLKTLHIKRETYHIVRREYSGIRVRHNGFVEWPILVPYSKGELRWAVYEFNGEKSSPDPNDTIPEVVKRVVKEVLTTRE